MEASQVVCVRARSTRTAPTLYIYDTCGLQPCCILGHMHVQPIHHLVHNYTNEFYERLSFFNNVISKPYLIFFCYAVGFKSLLEIDFQEWLLT
jgi:hypothetical protein